MSISSAFLFSLCRIVPSVFGRYFIIALYHRCKKRSKKFLKTFKNVKSVVEIKKKTFKNIDKKTLALICSTSCLKPNDVSAIAYIARTRK